MLLERLGKQTSLIELTVDGLPGQRVVDNG